MLKIKFLVLKWKLLTFLLFFLPQILLVLTRTCNQIDQCSCQFDDDSGIIDLSSIGGQTNVPL